MGTADGRPFEVLTGGREGPPEDLAVRRERFAVRLRAEARRRLDPTRHEDRVTAGELEQLALGSLMELVIELEDRDAREMAYLMQPGFGT